MYDFSNKFSTFAKFEHLLDGDLTDDITVILSYLYIILICSLSFWHKIDITVSLSFQETTYINVSTLTYLFVPNEMHRCVPLPFFSVA